MPYSESSPGKLNVEQSRDRPINDECDKSGVSEKVDETYANCMKSLRNYLDTTMTELKLFYAAGRFLNLTMP